MLIKGKINNYRIFGLEFKKHYSKNDIYTNVSFIFIDRFNP